LFSEREKRRRPFSFGGIGISGLEKAKFLAKFLIGLVNHFLAKIGIGSLKPFQKNISAILGKSEGAEIEEQGENPKGRVLKCEGVHSVMIPFFEGNVLSKFLTAQKGLDRKSDIVHLLSAANCEVWRARGLQT